MEITMTLTNSREIKKAMRLVPAKAAKEFRGALERVAADVTARAIKAAPTGKGEGSGKKGYGGNLKQSIRYTPYGQAGFLVRVGADYGVYVDQGTKPHVILPRRKPMLAFKIDGRWIRTKRVNHPGTKPTFFFSHAVRDAEKNADLELSKAANRVLSSI